MLVSAEERVRIDAEIRAASDREEWNRAATLALEAYGSEVLGFLLTQFRDSEQAADVFSEFSEQFWHSLPQFEWRCSPRTWAYKLARNAASRYRHGERHHARAVQLTRPSELSQAVERVRSRTSDYLRTEVKDRFQQLREELPQDDQALLVLRVDRDMSWLELAEVMLDGESKADAPSLKKEAARLRKRYQLVKERLRDMARSAGLLPTV